MLCASLFFVFQAIDGSFISNLKMNISAERFHNTQESDFLVVKIGLEKGIIGSITLKNIQIQDDCSKKGFKDISTNKYEFSKGIAKKTSHPLALATGDKISFSEYFEVSSTDICNIKVIVNGDRNTWGYPQWVSTLVSFPNADLTKP